MRSWLAQVFGMVTVLTLVVAPACAPLCAAKVCWQSLGSAEEGSPCHSVAMERENAVHVHAAQSCGAPELPAAALNSANKNETQHDGRSSAFGGLPYSTQEVVSAPEQLQDSCTSWPKSSSSLSPASVLRI